jgi:hypothetical protein
VTTCSPRDPVVWILLHSHALYPLREVVGNALLEEPLLADAVRVADEGEGPSTDVRKHEVGDAPVVADKFGLRDAILREQDLVRVGNVHVAAIDADAGACHELIVSGAGDPTGPRPHLARNDKAPRALRTSALQ